MVDSVECIQLKKCGTSKQFEELMQGFLDLCQITEMQGIDTFRLSNTMWVPTCSISKSYQFFYPVSVDELPAFMKLNVPRLVYFDDVIRFVKRTPSENVCLFTELENSTFIIAHGPRIAYGIAYLTTMRCTSTGRNFSTNVLKYDLDDSKLVDNTTIHKFETSSPRNKNGKFYLPCQVCGKYEHTKLCDRCRKVAYCSKKHQKEDWCTKHKSQCTKSKETTKEAEEDENEVVNLP